MEIFWNDVLYLVGCTDVKQTDIKVQEKLLNI